MFLNFIPCWKNVSPLCRVRHSLDASYSKTRSFLAIPHCNNRITSIEFVAEHQALSRPSCAAMCVINCRCFGFNSLTKKCRIHQSCNCHMPLDMTSIEGGWIYYQIDRKYFSNYRPIF